MGNANFMYVDNPVLLWMALSDTPGIGPARIKGLYQKHNEIKAIYEHIYSTSNSKLLNNAKEFLLNVNFEKYHKIYENTLDCGGNVCTIDDPIYPQNLSKISNPPSILYYKGSLSELSERSLALVGTVEPSTDGIEKATRFAKRCVENNIQVISGLARGIDTASHKAALSFSGKTYAVVAYGIDYVYPSENKALFDEIYKNGAIISQFPTGTRPQKWMFPMRNEVMCTLSSGTVIIEAHKGCGSLIQAQFSFKHGRRVFVLHSSYMNSGNEWAQGLVTQGAIVVERFDTVTREVQSVTKGFVSYDSTVPVSDNLKVADGFINGCFQPSIFHNPLGQECKLKEYAGTKCKKKAALFDLDGVLFDAEKFMLIAYIRTLKQLGVDNINEQSIRPLLSSAPTYVFRKIGVDYNRGNDVYKKLYLNLIPNHATFFPNVKEILDELKRHGFVIGIITSQPLSRYRAIIDKAAFKVLIEIAITWNDIPRGQKKDVGIIKALDKFDCVKEGSFYLGDTTNDMHAAMKAGIAGIAATWGLESKDSLLKSPYKYIISNLNDILNLPILK